MNRTTLIVVAGAVLAVWYFGRQSSAPRKGPDGLPAPPPAQPQPAAVNFQQPVAKFAPGAIPSWQSAANWGVDFAGKAVAVTETVQNLLDQDDD